MNDRMFGVSVGRRTRRSAGFCCVRPNLHMSSKSSTLDVRDDKPITSYLKSLNVCAGIILHEDVCVGIFVSMCLLVVGIKKQVIDDCVCSNEDGIT